MINNSNAQIARLYRGLWPRGDGLWQRKWFMGMWSDGGQNYVAVAAVPLIVPQTNRYMLDGRSHDAAGQGRRQLLYRGGE